MEHFFRGCSYSFSHLGIDGPEVHGVHGLTIMWLRKMNTKKSATNQPDVAPTLKSKVGTMTFLVSQEKGMLKKYNRNHGFQTFLHFGTCSSFFLGIFLDTSMFFSNVNLAFVALISTVSHQLVAPTPVGDVATNA